MLLALDVGNTNITIGVFKRKEIIEVFRITTKLPRTSDEFGILISNLLKEKGLEGYVFLMDADTDLGMFVNKDDAKIYYFHPSGYLELAE